MLDTFNQFLEEPVKVWHLLVACMVFAIPAIRTLDNMQKQLSAIGKCAYETWEKLHPLPSQYEDR